MPVAPPIYPDFAGIKFSRTSCNLVWTPFGGPPITIGGWKSVNYEMDLTPGETYGNRSKMQGRTRGKFAVTCDVEIYMQQYWVLRNALSAAGLLLGQGFMEVSSTIVFTGFEPLIGIVEADILGARISKNALAVGDGEDELSKKLTLHCFDILEDGQSAVFESTSTGLPG